MNSDTTPLQPQPDLQECAREPIHIPGRIQPHGVLLALEEPGLLCRVASANTEVLLGQEPSAVLERPLEEILGEAAGAQVRAHLREAAGGTPRPRSLTCHLQRGIRTFDALFHRHDGLLILELEPADPGVESSFPDFYHRVRGSLARLQGAGTIRELCQAAAEEVRSITDFDRVMVYQFDPEWNGEVIAEARAEEMEPFLGLHYPASDIPAQARQLYTINWIRLISDVDYRPVGLEPALNPLTGCPLDMSFSVLRSVSPVHIEYLQNMEVGASMSVSLLREGKLWGLIALHHRTPRHVPYAVRSACEFLGQMLSLQFSLRERQEDLDYRFELRSTLTRLRARVAPEIGLPQALSEGTEDLLKLVGAAGAALIQEEEVFLLGETPPAEAVRRLVGWLETQHVDEPVATDALPTRWPEAEAVRDAASGLLSVTLSRTSRLLWFRPEVVRVVNWSGDPRKPVRTEPGGPRIHPRKSFELWKETVRGRSRPWHPAELEAAIELRAALVDSLLRQAETEAKSNLEKLNVELARSNTELDAFAHVASHDLREPLRGIRNYAMFLLEDYQEQLDAEGLGRLTTIQQLCNRMEQQMEALLHYSRVGRTELAVGETDLTELVKDVLALLGPRLEQEQVEVRLPRPLPTLCCDRVRVVDLYTNLITNAMKYNDKVEKWIEIGYREALSEEPDSGEAVPVLYVRDNGIGIPEKDREAVFTMFRRLHGREHYGGGTGAGLTIARRIVERHGGKIWIESEPGLGTTFCFTLPTPPA